MGQFPISNKRSERALQTQFLLTSNSLNKTTNSTMAEEGMRSNSPQIQRNSVGLCEKPTDQEKKDIKAELSMKVLM